jgi:phosphoribosylglycinamide formyltransferase-1
MSRIAVFASGAGSNLHALLRHLRRSQQPPGERPSVALVASNRAASGALTVAAREGVPTHVISDPGNGTALDALLAEHGIDLVVLAGYLRRVPSQTTSVWRGRVLNVHPALLPAFGGPGMYGMRVHQAVIDAGVGVTGVTVHFVDEIYDHGPIIAQWPVPVLRGDTAPALADRVLRVEHRLYPCAVEAVAAGRIHLDLNGRVHGQLGDGPPGDAFSLRDEETLRPCA